MEKLKVFSSSACNRMDFLQSRSQETWNVSGLQAAIKISTWMLVWKTRNIPLWVHCYDPKCGHFWTRFPGLSPKCCIFSAITVNVYTCRLTFLQFWSPLFLPADLVFILPYAPVFNCTQVGNIICLLWPKREHQINPTVIQNKVMGMGYWVTLGSLQDWRAYTGLCW